MSSLGNTSKADKEEGIPPEEENKPNDLRRARIQRAIELAAAKL